MLKETKGLEYSLEIIRALHYNQGGKHDSKSIHSFMRDNSNISLSYVQKVLPRLSKIGILESSEAGYSLAIPATDITVAHFLDFCDMPLPDSPINNLCAKIKEELSTIKINTFCNFI